MIYYGPAPQLRTFAFGEMNVIELGERGRGRWQEIIPAPADLKTGDCVALRATRSNKPKIVRAECGDGNEHLMVISTSGVYTRNTIGGVSVHPDFIDHVTYVTSGNGAYGMAGRVGSWRDYLLIVRSPALLRVKPVGGYKTPAYYLAIDGNNVTKIGREEYDLFLEQRDDGLFPPLDGDVKFIGIHNAATNGRIATWEATK